MTNDLTHFAHAIGPISVVIIASNFFEIRDWMMKVWRRVTALLVSLVLAGCANTGDIAQDNATNSALAGLAVGTLVGAAVTRPAPSPTVVVPTYGYGYAPYGYAPYGYRPPMRPVHPLGLVYPHGRR